jgi:hypothetical protein
VTLRWHRVGVSAVEVAAPTFSARGRVVTLVTGGAPGKGGCTESASDPDTSRFRVRRAPGLESGLGGRTCLWQPH